MNIIPLDSSIVTTKQERSMLFKVGVVKSSVTISTQQPGGLEAWASENCSDITLRLFSFIVCRGRPKLPFNSRISYSSTLCANDLDISFLLHEQYLQTLAH